MTRSLVPTFLPLFVVFIIVIARRPALMLRRRGAVTPETAQPLADLRAGDRRRLERLVARGVIREAAPGTYYYDRAGEHARMRRQLPIALGLVVVAAALALAILYLERLRRGAA